MGNKDKSHPPAKWHAFAGVIAAIISTVFLHPLDLLKVKLQVTENTKNFNLTTFNFMQSVFIKKGGFKAAYKGLTPNLVGSAASWGLYFFYYTKIKEWMRNPNLELKPWQHLSASAAAGSLTCLFANPIFVIKTRMFTQHVNDPNRYLGLFDGLQKLYKNEGTKGLYRGIIPALFGVSHGAIQFMAYEELKILRAAIPLQDKETTRARAGAVEYIGMAAVSKIVAVVCTYPYQVVKSRMQIESKYLCHEYRGVLGTIKSIYRFERIRGFYKGLGVNIIRVLPGTCITFGAYEIIISALSAHP